MSIVAAKRTLISSDILLALFVIAIMAMLLLPLPPFLLDFLIVINISIALLVLLAGLYMPNALSLLAFPTLLLLTTLFRLGLNVAATRLVLSNGEAGDVIRSFGRVLIGDEVAVGLVIFVIITIVSFIVIARGASRVSEVAARFALDALPGKQLAIDSDLRSGLINASQAQVKREELRKESQLYGAMDGAMRFVQGDAIAGFFIIFTNIVGGLYLGVSRGDSFADAVHKYTILTVGDGLVSQIPALLMSICAGLVVTRVSSGENTTLGIDLNRQVFGSPRTLIFVGILLSILGSFESLPQLPFMGVGIFLIGFGLIRLRNSRGQKAPAAEAQLKLGQTSFAIAAPEESAALPEQTGPLASADAEIVVTLDASILFKLYRMHYERYAQFWNDLRADFFSQTGCILPGLTIQSDENELPAHYSVSLHGSEIFVGDIVLDSVLVEVSVNEAEALGLPVALEVSHPLSGNRVFWSPQSPALRRLVDASQLRVLDFMEFILLKVAVFCHRSPEEVVTLTHTHSLLSALERKHPGLVAEVFGQQPVPIARLTELLQRMVADGLSIRDFRQILEALALYGASHGGSWSSSEELEMDEVYRFIRQNRRRQIVSGCLSQRRTLKVISMSSSVEELFEEVANPAQGALPGFAPQVFEGLRSSFATILDPLRLRGLAPVALLCRAQLSTKCLSFLKHCADFPVAVVAFEELDPGVEIEPLGQWVLE